MSKFCGNCGTQLSDDAAFCGNCGASQGAYNQQAQYSQAQYSQQPPQQPPVRAVFNGSGYDGSVLDTFVNALVASLIITFTCGIATPWAVVYMWTFILSHVSIDGKRLTFDGTGGDLFGKWIVWMILTCITCGIYGFWVAPKMYNWIASHTHFAN